MLESRHRVHRVHPGQPRHHPGHSLQWEKKAESCEGSEEETKEWCADSKDHTWRKVIGGRKEERTGMGIPGIIPGIIPPGGGMFCCGGPGWPGCCCIGAGSEVLVLSVG